MSQTPNYEAMYEDLLQFLYRTPWGLVQTDRSGDIQMLNPVAARILMQFTNNGRLDNFFRLTKSMRPELQGLAEQFKARYGVVCEDLPLVNDHIDNLSVSIFVQNESCLMVVLRERLLPARKSPSSAFSAKFDALMDHPLIGVLSTVSTKITHANAAAYRMTGAAPGKLIEETLEQLFSDPAGQLVLERCLPVLMAGEQISTIARLPWNGKAKTYAISAHPPSSGDGQTHWIVVEQCADVVAPNGRVD